MTNLLTNDDTLWVDLDDPEHTTYTSREAATLAAIDRADALASRGVANPSHPYVWARVGVALPIDIEDLAPDDLADVVIARLRRAIDDATPRGVGDGPDEEISDQNMEWLQRGLVQSIAEWQRVFGWLKGRVRIVSTHDVLTLPRRDTHGNVIGFSAAAVPFDEGVVTKRGVEALLNVYRAWETHSPTSRLLGIEVPHDVLAVLRHHNFATPRVMSSRTVEVPMRQRNPRSPVTLTALGLDVGAWFVALIRREEHAEHA